MVLAFSSSFILSRNYARPTPSASFTLFLGQGNELLSDVQDRDMTGEVDVKHEASNTPTKVCFVTIGATASFDKLLKAVLESSFLQALRDAKYTNLIIQYGKEEGKAIYDSFVAREHDSIKQNGGLEVFGFDFNTNGLGQEMRRAKGGSKTGSEEGLVISHAGWIQKSLQQ